MKKYNTGNERIKRKYFQFLKEAKRRDEKTIDYIAKSINRFESYTKFRDFKNFHFEQAVGFKKYLGTQVNYQTGEKLSKSTLHSTLGHLKAFVEWLSMQSGYKSRISYCDAEYFNLSEKDARIAKTRNTKPIPTLEQIKHVISMMPSGSDIELRNRALIAFVILTGARDGAIASLKLKHIEPYRNCVFQDAREVNTKFSKSMITYFFPVGDDIKDIVLNWVEYLRSELLWGNNDPLFPATDVQPGEMKRFVSIGLRRSHWSNASPIREIFRRAFEDAGLQYFNPHSFRNTLAILGEKKCKTPEEFKAWSQNLGHEKVMTTFTSYGEVSDSRQCEIILNLPCKNNRDNIDAEKLAEAIIKKIKSKQIL